MQTFLTLTDADLKAIPIDLLGTLYRYFLSISLLTFYIIRTLKTAGVTLTILNLVIKLVMT